MSEQIKVTQSALDLADAIIAHQAESPIRLGRLAIARVIARHSPPMDALQQIADACDEGDCTCELGDGMHALSCCVAIKQIATAALAAAQNAETATKRG
mgnify:CR=1 FL=1